MNRLETRAINFAHIMPASYLEHLGTYPRAELVLAHIAKENWTYCDWFYKNPPEIQARGQKIRTKRIMDNGAFELGQSMQPNELISLGKEVNATHLVLPDYPGQSSKLTIEAAQKWAPAFKRAGFKTVFVPQGEVGSIDDFEKALKWGIDATRVSLNSSNEMEAPLVDEIAMSIIAVPNIYRVYKNKTQRMLARWHYMSTLPQRNPHLYRDFEYVPIHMLGLLDGINEIALIRQMQEVTPYNIHSWDSSAAAWYAFNQVPLDDGTPTGRVDGKFELEVDFAAPFYANRVPDILANMQQINRLCGHKE